MVNKALRTEDVQQLHTFRFYINDLCSTLAEEYKNRQMEDDQMSTMIYCGVQLLKNELEQFQSNERKLISINEYLSASHLERVAMMFAIKEPRRINSVPVLFEIECLNEENQCSFL